MLGDQIEPVRGIRIRALPHQRAPSRTGSGSAGPGSGGGCGLAQSSGNPTKRFTRSPFGPAGALERPRPSFPHFSLAVQPPKRDRAPSAILSAAPLWASDTLEFRIDKDFRVSAVLEGDRFLQTMLRQHLTEFSAAGIPRFWTASISILMVIDPETRVGYAFQGPGTISEPMGIRKRGLSSQSESPPRNGLT